MNVLTRVSVPYQQSTEQHFRPSKSGEASSAALKSGFIRPLRLRSENPLQVAPTFSQKQESRSGGLEITNQAGWNKSGHKGEARSSQKAKAASGFTMTGPACRTDGSIDEEPHPYCRLNHGEALRLAKSAIEGKHFPERAELMGKVRTPWDILTADRAIAEALDEANQGSSPEQVKQNHMRALFLRDNVGQCVINQAMKTWHGKRVMAAYVLKVLPSEMLPRIPSVRDLSGDGQLNRETARKLADSVIAGKSLKNQHKLVEEVIGFKDLVMLEEEAIQSLAKAVAKAPHPKARAQHAMNFLFLLHEVGTQTANRVMTERSDRVAYMKHMVKSLFVL